MKLTFDYYHNLEKVDLYLCNPDGRELFPLPGKSRNLTLRFNDLSELTFEVDSKITLSNGTIVDLDAYDYIQTKRLVYATNVGWFQISGVDEHDNGVVKYKSVTTESYQSVLKNKGFISEERVYCFYNPNDPHDDRYDSTKDDSIPSVLGQWSKQLGIKQALGQGLTEPATPYDDWTVTYIHSSLIYSGTGSKCRTFKENVTYGYDWIVNDVEDAFEVVILFDFMYKTIHVMTPNEVAQRVNVLYTFNNFMKNIDINEDSEDIVTVLNCNGDNCDITAVNPTGTNYICDFSYYMDKTNYRWMSSALITKLEQWKADCDAQKTTYTNYVSQLRFLWLQKTQCVTSLQEMSLSLQDLKNAQNKRSVVGSGTPGALCGIVAAESVQSGKKSIKSGTTYYSTAFTGSKTITAYRSSPSYNATTRKWVFSGAYKTGTADSIVASNLSDSNTSGVSYWYFSDVSDGSSYCKLQSAVTVNKDSATSTYYCGGFDRYIAYSYPIIDESTGATTYTDTVQSWINLRESLVNSLNATDASLQASIDSVSAQLDAISSQLNILAYFANTPGLLRELNCYWIEGDYTNENIAVLEETTPEEEIDLSNELLAAGYVELSKVCQPRFSFSLESRDATKQYEFKDQMRLLELGKIITIEKEEGLWYYPALLEIAINLDNSEEFTMTFANAMRLDDWGYTYADLISDASSTSRKVSANWQDILAYAKEREVVTSLIRDPLDMTFRAAFANMVNQEFTVDKNGILGRKKVSETSDEFEDEQVRLINNLLIFTDDNWETAKTALGKIYYTDEDGNTITSYGLIAETIIGQLIMGEKLQIRNQGNTVQIDGMGISIKKPTYAEDGSLLEYRTMFEANADTGKLYVHEAEITGDIKGGSINLSDNFIVNSSGSVTIKKGSINLNNNFHVGLDGAVTIKKGSINLSDNFTVNNDGAVVANNITANGGKIGGLMIGKSNICGGSTTTGDIYDATSLVGLNMTNWDGQASAHTRQSVVRPTLDDGAINYSTVRFFAGAKWGPNHNYIDMFPAKFVVLNDGSLYAEAVNIKGTINATGGSIGSLQISNSGVGIDNDDGSFTWISSSRVCSNLAVFDEGHLGGWAFDDCVAYCYGMNGKFVSQVYTGVEFTNTHLISEQKLTASSVALRTSVEWSILTMSTTGSDARIKNSIETLPEQYNTFFDLLEPKRYKYNDGTSHRYHTGYIAQEVVDSLEKSGLNTHDFAAVMLTHPGTEKECWHLRRDEFVALNTWQIQKLKARVAELENLVYQLTNKE